MSTPFPIPNVTPNWGQQMINAVSERLNAKGGPPLFGAGTPEGKVSACPLGQVYIDTTAAPMNAVWIRAFGDPVGLGGWRRITAPNVAVSFQTLAGPTNVVDMFDGGVQEWEVTANTKLTLPSVPSGSIYQVHVRNGAEKISWPTGTVVYGANTTTEVWLTLVKMPSGWVVMLPSTSAVSDSGWVPVVAGAITIGDAGPEVTYFEGSAASLGDQWEPDLSAGKGVFGISFRRNGNTVFCQIGGLRAKYGGNGPLLAPGLFMDRFRGPTSFLTVPVRTSGDAVAFRTFEPETLTISADIGDVIKITPVSDGGAQTLIFTWSAEGDW